MLYDCIATDADTIHNVTMHNVHRLPVYQPLCEPQLTLPSDVR